jgi:predicted enzyme related to lactoylglutathione lyase
MITTDQDIDDIAKRITEGGGTLELPPTDTPMGVRILRVRDPDGFRFTISSGFPSA